MLSQDAVLDLFWLEITSLSHIGVLSVQPHVFAERLEVRIVQMIKPVWHCGVDLFVRLIDILWFPVHIVTVFNHFAQVGIKINCLVHLEVQIDCSCKHFIVVYQWTD